MPKGNRSGITDKNHKEGSVSSRESEFKKRGASQVREGDMQKKQQDSRLDREQKSGSSGLDDTSRLRL